MKNTITQIQAYKGWKMYRQTREQFNGWGKVVTKLWYYAVKDDTYFCGGKKQVLGFINAGIPASKVDSHVETMLNPSSSMYEER